MRIHAILSGYHDWVEAPPGTEVTDEDLALLRFKVVEDGKYRMKVTFNDETSHDMFLPEQQVCDRMAALEKLGRAASRTEAITEILRKTWAHHMDLEHLKKIEVQDDGPQTEMFEEALAKFGVVDEAIIAKATSRYTRQTDIEKYLNVVFQTEAQ